jgi:hypothetical protein
MTAQVKPPEVKRLSVPKDGTAMITAETDITEKEIVQDRERIIKNLHAAYLTLSDEMAPFQEQWDANPTKAFLDAAAEGALQGGEAWLHDQGELFEKKTWVELGGKIEHFADNCYDRFATYSKKQYKDMEREVNKHVANPEATLYNWAWWQKAIGDQVTETVRNQTTRLESAGKQVTDTIHAVEHAVETARKIYKHRDAIMNLPVLIAAGAAAPIQRFVEVELMDIDKELATAIRYDPNFAVVLEIIADNESALTYLAYVGLMIEAIPPNFYAYIAGKGAAYVVIEVVLLVVTALLSAGAAAAARIAALIARLAASSAKLAGVAKKVRRAKAAVESFIRALEDLNNAVNDLHGLGAKLVKARRKGLKVPGNTKSQLVAKKEGIRRDKRCRCCGSTVHTTPRMRRGTVVYA